MATHKVTVVGAAPSNSGISISYIFTFLFYFMNNYKTQRSTHVTNFLHFDLNKGIYSIIVTNKSDKKHVIYLLRPTQSYTFHVMLIAVWCGTKCSFFLTKFFRESRFLPTQNYYCRFSLFIFWYHHLFYWCSSVFIVINSRDTVL